MFTCVLGSYVASTVLLVSESADSVGAGHTRGDNECRKARLGVFDRGWRKGAGKRGLECVTEGGGKVREA